MKIPLTLILLVCAIHVDAQNIVLAAQWDNPIYFQNSKEPTIKRYGELSDSLSNVFDGVDFYILGEDYYAVNSWADYYLWFTEKYWYMFPTTYQIYRFHYYAGNNIEMAKIIAGDSYLGSYYPSSIRLDFGDLNVLNRLDTESNSYSIDRFNEENEKFRRQAQRRRVRVNNVNKIVKPKPNSFGNYRITSTTNSDRGSRGSSRTNSSNPGNHLARPSEN